MNMDMDMDMNMDVDVQTDITVGIHEYGYGPWDAALLMLSVTRPVHGTTGTDLRVHRALHAAVDAAVHAVAFHLVCVILGVRAELSLRGTPGRICQAQCVA